MDNEDYIFEIEDCKFDYQGISEYRLINPNGQVLDFPSFKSKKEAEEYILSKEGKTSYSPEGRYRIVKLTYLPQTITPDD